MVPMLEKAAMEVAAADIVIIVGTSMQVYPAAGLVSFASREADIYYVDPKPNVSNELRLLKKLRVISSTATKGISSLADRLLS
jgi:NAD-dependent deacetylase